MVGWHHRLNGHEFGQTPREYEGQEGLACCSPWGHKESDTTRKLKNKSGMALKQRHERHVQIQERASKQREQPVQRPWGQGRGLGFFREEPEGRCDWDVSLGEVGTK